MSASSLTAKQELALTALLNQPTIASAAAQAGASERTLRRWLSDPTFAGEYQRARRQAVQQATARLQQIAWAAVQTLVVLMSDARTAPAVRLNAASRILDLAIKAVEVDDLEQRIAELEQKYEQAELERAGQAPGNGVE